MLNFPNSAKDLGKAKEVGYTKLLAKLSAGDMITIKAKYHCKCLEAYYIKVRNEEIISNIQPANETSLQIIIFQWSDILSDYAKIYVSDFSFNSVNIFFITSNKHILKIFVSCIKVLE